MRKSMNYYKNIKKGNIFIIKNNLASFFNHNKKKLYNNRILLRDILLQEKNYFNLKYDEKNIYLSPDIYNDYIKEQLMLIKKNKLKLEYPEKFIKIYDKSNYNKPKLILNPIVIEFEQKYSFDNNNFNINDKQMFNIPFEYIPIFYFNNSQKLKEILISIFYMDENFKTFFVKYENLSYILKTSHEFKENNEDFKDNKKDIFKKEFTYKLQLTHSQTLTKSGLLFKNPKKSQNPNSLKLIDIYSKEYNFNEFPNYLNKLTKNKDSLNRNKEKYFNKNNIFEFIWLTSSYQYLVTIKAPEITFKINEMEIKKNIDIELLFFLLQNKFKNWDFYVIENLFSYYDFILIINDHFSIYKTKLKLLRNLKYNYDYKNNIINLTQEKKLKYSKKNFKLEFIFTDNSLNNYIKILHNYKLFVYNKKINPFYQFCFHLNFIQMKSFYLASQKQNIKYLLEKMIIIDKENMKIKLNYEYLDNFCENDFNNLEPLFPNTIQIKANKYNFNINDSKFCLFYPILETIKFNANAEKNNNCFESNLEEELKDGMNMNILESLFKNNDIYKWPSILEFIDKEKLKRQKKKVPISFPNINNQIIYKLYKNRADTLSSKNVEIMGFYE